MGGKTLVTLDPLPLKRVLALEETGIELYTPEASQDEKPLSLIQSLDIDRPAEREAKKQKKDGSSAAQQSWPWQGFVEQFSQAREELMTLLDFVSKVETGESLTVTNMMKPKPLPNEACTDLALRIAIKSRKYKDVAQYLKRHAKAMERQVERESVFYEALMRLQRNWKIKRQRGVSAGPGGKAGFMIDLCFPLNLDSSLRSSLRTAPLTLIKVDQDANGLLSVQLPPNRSITSFQLQLFEEEGNRQILQKPSIKLSHIVRKEGEAVDEGAKSANLRLRDIQLSMFDELMFECLCREALQPSSGTSLIAMDDASLRVGSGDSLTTVFKLSDDDNLVQSTGEGRVEDSYKTYLQHAFYSALLSSRASRTKATLTSILRHYSVLVSHHQAASKVTSIVDKLVLEVPNLIVQSRPTWKPFVSVWDVHFDIPDAIYKGGVRSMGTAREAFQCTIVLMKESISVKGLDCCIPIRSSSHEEPTEFVCNSISELPFFLLSQIASKIVKWLEDEALLIGCRVKRGFLGLTFNGENNGLISLVAAPSDLGIYWWLRLFNSGPLDEVVPRPPSNERFLGPLPLETLREMVVSLTQGHPDK